MASATPPQAFQRLDPSKKSLLLDFPPEIQERILKAFYVPGARFPLSTALLRVSRLCYALAQPTFLANYLFVCVPLRPYECNDESVAWIDGEDGERYDADESDLYDAAFYRNSVRHHGTVPLLATTGDLSRLFRLHESEFWISDAWRSGLRVGLKNLFSAATRDRVNPTTKIIRDRFVSQNISDGYRAQVFVYFFLRQNAFARGLQLMGPDKVAKIQHLRISWDRDEDSREAIEDHEVGPYTISIMEVICSLWMPKLKKVEFVHTGPAQYVRAMDGDREDGDLIAVEDAKDSFIEERGCSRYYADWRSVLQLPVQEHLVLAIQQFLDMSPGVEELKMDLMNGWYISPRPEWWKEVICNNGTAIRVRQRVYTREDAERSIDFAIRNREGIRVKIFESEWRD